MNNLPSQLALKSSQNINNYITKSMSIIYRVIYFTIFIGYCACSYFSIILIKFKLGLTYKQEQVALYT
jgi:hypothetical protein